MIISYHIMSHHQNPIQSSLLHPWLQGFIPEVCLGISRPIGAVGLAQLWEFPIVMN